MSQLIQLLEGVDHTLFASYLQHNNVQQELVKKLYRANMENLQQIFIMLQRPEDQEQLYKIEGMRKDLQHLVDDAGALEEQISQLPVQIEAQQAKNKKQQQAIEHQQTQIAKLDAMIQQEARQQQESKGRVQQEIKVLQNQYAQICEELERKQTHLKELKAQVSRELGEQQEEIRRLETQRSRLVQENQQLRASITQEEQHNRAQVELQQHSRSVELSQLEALEKDLVRELNRAQQTNQRYNLEIAQYQSQIVQSQNDLKAAQEQFDQKTQENQRELQKIQDEIDALPIIKIITKQEQQETLRAIEKNRRNQLYVELEEKKSATQQIRQQLKDKQEMLVTIKKQTQDNEELIKKLQAELKSIEVPDREYLEGRIVTLKQEIEHQKAELKGLNSVSSSKDKAKRLRSPVSSMNASGRFILK